MLWFNFEVTSSYSVCGYYIIIMTNKLINISKYTIIGVIDYIFFILLNCIVLRLLSIYIHIYIYKYRHTNLSN